MTSTLDTFSRLMMRAASRMLDAASTLTASRPRSSRSLVGVRLTSAATLTLFLT
jgi:hypothetical protein